jgi:hypothetical protein
MPGEARLTEAEFTALATRAGLQLTPEKRAALFEAYRNLEELARRVRRPRDLGAEPAATFTPIGAKQP